MKRNLYLIFFLSLASLSASQGEKPNIVFVLTDDQGYGDLGYTGNRLIQTPNMDKLAAESSVLENYHVAPTCSPTRAALLTGHWSNRTGVWHTIMGRSMLRTDEVTLGQLLQDNGYETGMFGKWHLGDNYPYRPEDRGFKEVYRHAGGGIGQTPDYWNNAYFDGTYLHNGNRVPAKGFCTDVFFEAGNHFIRQCVREGKPFFAYISTNAPHSPYHCPEEYMAMYPGLPSRTAAFYGMITNIDDNLGKTRALLKELGVYENTIFIFSTDNGTSSGEAVFNAGMRGKKGSEYDGGHRVPFFIHWPNGGLSKNYVVQEITHAVDLVPTLMDLTNSEIPEGLEFDGVSLRALIDPRIDVDWPERIIVSDSQRVVDPIKWRKSSVMTDRWRLINGTELYDMKTDPGQSVDLAAKYPDQVGKMRDFYEDWWAELSPSFSETTEIYIGQPGEEKVALTCHDWVDVHRAPPWSQSQIRWARGIVRRNELASTHHQGYWAIKVIRSGTYDISVMRWPEEANHPIRAGLPADRNVPGASRAYRANEGVALDITHVSLHIDGAVIASQPVTEEDTMITFKTKLTEGSHKLAPVFHLKQGGNVGTYYAIIEKQ